MSFWRATLKRVVKLTTELEAKMMKRVSTLRVKVNWLPSELSTA